MRYGDWKRGRIDHNGLWDIQLIKNLPYVRETFNDHYQLELWRSQGHQPKTGGLFDMRRSGHPSSTQSLIDCHTHLEHVGISYYEMQPGDNLPYHSDTYKKYIEVFHLRGREKRIWRYIFFVEDWKPGHIFEIDGMPISQWRAGDYVAWRYDVPHMAANLGTENRYTIQLTGVEIAGI